jgi:RIO kinase 1
MRKKTSFGQELTHNSWLLYEYGTLQRLHALGAAIPRPIANGGNAILMEYIGDERMAASALHAVRLDVAEAHTLFTEVLRNIELMLKHELIHGDLSAFNILYWQGKVTLIDFPQITAALSNRNAYQIFSRDVIRVCEYFENQGLPCDGPALAEKLWWQYIGVKPGHQLTDEDPV